MTRAYTMRCATAVVMLLAVLGLAACGGDGEKSSPKSAARRSVRSTPLTKSELIARADSICRRAKTRIDAVDVPSDIQDADQATTYFTQVSTLSDSTLTQLHRLTPPSSLAADWRAYIGKQQEYIDLIHTLRDKAKAGDRSGLQDLQRAPTLNRETDAAADKVGAKVCGSDN